MTETTEPDGFDSEMPRGRGLSRLRALSFEESAASAELELVGPDFEGQLVRITGPNGEVFDAYLTREPVPPDHDGITYTYTVTPA